MRRLAVTAFGLVLLGCQSHKPKPAAGESPPAPRFNEAPDEGPGEPRLLLAVPRPAHGIVGELQFLPDGRWLLANDRTFGLWDFDAEAASLKEVGWFGLAADRDEPPEAAKNDIDQLQAWAKTHEAIYEMAMPPDASWVAGLGMKGTLALWSLQPDKSPIARELGRVAETVTDAYGLAASRDGKRLIVLGRPSDAQASGFAGELAQGMIHVWGVDANASTPLAPGAFEIVEHRPGAAAFTPDGRHALVFASSRRFSILELDGTAIRTHTRMEGDDSITDVAILDDGRTVLTAGFDQTVRVWQLVLDGEPRLEIQHVLRHHQARVETLAVAPDASWLAANSPDKTISLWPLRALAKKELVEPFTFSPDPDDYTYGIAIHPHGPFFATGGNEIRVWRVNRQELAKGRTKRDSVVLRSAARGQLDTLVLAAAWIGDDRLISVSLNGSIRAWKWSEAGLAVERESGPTPTQCLAAAIGDETIVRGCKHGALDVIPITDFETVQSVPMDDKPTVSLALSGACVAAATAGGGLTIWRHGAVGLTPAAEVDDAFGDSVLVALSPGARLMFASGRNRGNNAMTLLGLDPASCRPDGRGGPQKMRATPSGSVLSSSSYPGGGKAPTAAAFSPDGSWLLTADGAKGGALLWRVDAANVSLAHAHMLLGHNAGADAVAFARNAALAVTGGDDGETFLWKLSESAAPTRIEALSPPSSPAQFTYAVDFSPQSSRLVSAGGRGKEGRLWVFELSDGR